MRGLNKEDEEKERLISLAEYHILDTGEESPYNSVAWLAAYVCQTPVAFVSFIDEQRQWIKGKAGLDIDSVPRISSLCNYTIQGEKLLEVRDLSRDERFSHLQMGSGETPFRFYAGVPLATAEGHNIGSLCVMDFQPKTLDDQQKEALEILARQVLGNLETRKSNIIRQGLLEKAQKFQHLFNNSSELHAITDSEGRLEFVNSSVFEQLGYREEEMIGRTTWDFCVPGERERLMPDVYAAIAGGERRFRIETQMVTRQGEIKWFEWADVIMDGYWVINGRDVTERKSFEQKLKTLSLAVEKSPAGVVLRDAENKVVWINEACEQLIGYRLDEVQGREFKDLLVGPKTDMKVFEQAARALMDKLPCEIEIALYKKGGELIWVYLSNNPLFDNSGNFQSLITIALDITEKKKAELQLMKARQDAIDLSKSKELFLSVMSHEMRTPLNAVIGMTRILSEEEPLERQVENLKILEFSAQNLLTLINDVLDFTKIETGNLQLEHLPVHLEELVSKTIESLKFKSAEKNIGIFYKVDPAIPTVLADPTRLYQIFMNLLGNAVKFTHQGEVKLEAHLVSASAEAVDIRFVVQDTGIGIPSDKLTSIFDAYSQAESHTSRKYGGTGLGLSITKKLVELFESQIVVESVLGEGTSFSFTIGFEIARETAAGDNTEVPEVPINARVLVVDDNAINRLLARKVLEKWSIIVEVAENGLEAVEMVRKGNFDLVLMDLHMPEMGGEEATRVIRGWQDKKYAELPILALTGSALGEDRGRFIATGMNDFVLKPFDSKLLYRKLRQFLAPVHLVS